MKDNSRILFVTQFFPAPGSAGQTGGTISNLNLLRALAHGREVTVLSFDRSSSAGDFAREPFQVIARPPPVWRAPQLTWHWLGYVRDQASAALRDMVTPSLLIATTSTLAALEVAAPAVRRIALVRAYENFGFLCPSVPLARRVTLGKLAAVRRFQDARLMRSADAILTNSRFMRRAIASRFRIDQARIHILLQQCQVTPHHTEGPNGIVGFVNRGAEKGVEFVLELAQRAPDLRFVVFGHHAGLPSTLPGNVTWKGWESDRNAMFASARLWIMPSVWAEPFGRVSIEAQAADRAVLVAESGGLPETVNEPLFLIAGFDPDAWLQRMRGLMTYDAEALRRNGTTIRSIFSSAQHDVRIAEIVSAVLGGPRETLHAP